MIPECNALVASGWSFLKPFPRAQIGGFWSCVPVIDLYLICFVCVSRIYAFFLEFSPQKKKKKPSFTGMTSEKSHLPLLVTQKCHVCLAHLASVGSKVEGTLGVRLRNFTGEGKLHEDAYKTCWGWVSKDTISVNSKKP